MIVKVLNKDNPVEDAVTAEMDNETPPKFGPVPPRKKPEPKKSTASRSMVNNIAALLIQTNLMLAPLLKNDVMDDTEILALAKAVDDQAKKSPRFRKALVRMMEMSGGTGLVSISVIIIARRAARHGYLSPDWDQKLGAYLALTQMTPQQMMAQMEEAVSQMGMADMMAAMEQENDTINVTPEPGPIASPIREAE